MVFAIHWHESAMGARVPHPEPPLPPPSPSLPSGSSQCTSPEHPVSCTEPGLAICFTYDNIYVSMLFIQIIPPLPSPTESNRLFYTSVSLYKQFFDKLFTRFIKLRKDKIKGSPIRASFRVYRFNKKKWMRTNSPGQFHNVKYVNERP